MPGDLHTTTTFPCSKLTHKMFSYLQVKAHSVFHSITQLLFRGFVQIIKPHICGCQRGGDAQGVGNCLNALGRVGAHLPLIIVFPDATQAI